MARLAGVQRGGTFFTRLIFFLTKRRLGRVVQPQRIMALQPPVLRGFAFMEMAQQAGSAVPRRLKSLAQMLVATRVGCPF